jgi:hypothetical protein
MGSNTVVRNKNLFELAYVYFIHKHDDCLQR